MEERYLENRLYMVDRQIRSRGIKDVRVIEVMEKVPRHLFVPQSAVMEAYEDMPLAIGFGQTISQPYIVALMTELLKIHEDDKVLEIGTGSGYQSAVLSMMANKIYSIDIIENLSKSAEKRLRNLGYNNVKVITGDGYRGWPAAQPFNAIMITAAPDAVPPELLDQLADPGRMAVPVGRDRQQLLLIEKKDGKLEKRSIAAVRFVPMVKSKEE